MKDNFSNNRPEAETRFVDRRLVPRFKLIAPVEITEPIKKLDIGGRITGISRNGCFAEVPNPLTGSSIVQLRIRHSASTFETWARVLYDQPGLGFGLLFVGTAPDHWKLLTTWLEELEKS